MDIQAPSPLNPEIQRSIDLALDKIVQGLLITNGKGIVVTANNTAIQILNRPIDTLLGHPICQALLEEPTGKLKAAMLSMAAKPTSWTGEATAVTPNKRIPIRIDISPVRSPSSDQLHHVALLTDLTQNHQHRRELEALATTDRTTGLANSHLLKDRLEHGVALASRNQIKIALLHIVISNLHQITDSHGQGASETATQQVAERLLGRTREGDTVAKLGQNEFAIAITGLPIPEHAHNVATSIAELLSKPIQCEHDTTVILQPHIGATVAPDDGKDASALMRQAELAARAARKAQVPIRMFDPDMHKQATLRSSITHKLRSAMDDPMQFVPHFQAIVHGVTREILGYETLARWHHPTDGIISPAHFIPVAEETGLIVRLGQDIMAKACEIAAAIPGCNIAVNVSAAQFRHAKFLNLVRNTIAWSKLPPEQLTIEITESAVMHDIPLAVQILRELRAMGISISMDDFGTGHSSLGQLSNLHGINKLKIDQSFIKNIHRSDRSRQIVDVIVHLAKSLDMKVIAEGVETNEQLAVLTQLECYAIQGYLFSKPAAEPLRKVAA
jgi:diguanylate cyclase (GGDEF)-like protein